MRDTASPRSLQALLDVSPTIVEHLWRNPKGVLRAITTGFPPQHIPLEFTNWREEQRARREGVALLEQSFHMTNLWVRGPGALSLLSRLGVNGFRSFGPGKAKHYVCCTPEGFVIGDNILYALEDGSFLLVGGEPVLNWVSYHAARFDPPVTVERDPLWAANPTGRRVLYRFQVEGPEAPRLLEKLHGRPLPRVSYFSTTVLTIAGRSVLALRHTMAGVPGFELSGPWDEREEVRRAIVEVGAEFGLREVGSLAYLSSGGLESGWIPRPLPAIYTSPALRAYREWLPATTPEATGSLGGSFFSPHVEDYYLTPYELGLGHLVKFDHDFVGREALERLAQRPHRRKVTLVWNPVDTERLFGTLFGERTLGRYLDLPWLHYAGWQYDAVYSPQGELVGLALYAGYTVNARAVLSLAVVDEAWSVPGTEVILRWGEPDGGARSAPWLEPHEPVDIRATIQPAPLRAVTKTL